MKTILTFVLSVSLLFVGSITSYAKVDDAQNLRLEVAELLEMYGYDIVNLPSDASVVSIETISELEHYLQEISKVAEDNNQENVLIKQSSGFFPMSTVYNDSYRWRWWNPFSGFDGITLLCWSNVYSEYSYTFVNGRAQFHSFDKSSITSYLTGITISSWQQIGTVPRITTTHYTNDTYRIRVSGRYVLGVEIGGFLIGASRNSEWNVSLRFTD